MLVKSLPGAIVEGTQKSMESESLDLESSRERHLKRGIIGSFVCLFDILEIRENRRCLLKLRSVVYMYFS